MRKAGVIPEASRAEKFGDYLLSQGIENRVDTAQGGAIWILDDAHLEEARKALAEFVGDPDDSRFDRHREAEAIRRSNERAGRLARERFVDVRARWSSRAGAPFTVAIVVVCVALFAASRLGAGGLGARRLQSLLLFASGPGQLIRDLESGQVWRLVTPVFLHGGLLHLGFNMLWLFSLGRQIETRRSRWVYVGLFLVIAAFSNAAQYAWAGPYFVGMSGVVYGLFAYVWMQARFMTRPDLNVDASSSLMLMGWLVLCLTGVLGNVANGAHVGGLFIGALLGSRPLLMRRLGRHL